MYDVFISFMQRWDRPVINTSTRLCSRSTPDKIRCANITCKQATFIVSHTMSEQTAQTLHLTSILDYVQHNHIHSNVTPQSLSTYYIDATRQSCYYKTFFVSRFLIFKQILHCFQNSQNLTNIFGWISCHRSYPFWTKEQLALRPEFRA